MDEDYLELFLEPIRLCADYLPKFGTDDEEGVSLGEFRKLYASDPLYHWIGFDSDLMFAAHKASGGITSLYRQLGIACERLVRKVIQESMGLTNEQTSWSYEYEKPDGSKAAITLDARITLTDVKDLARRKRVVDWIAAASQRIGIPRRRSRDLLGAVFEIRQGYKSADSKRQNADLRSALRAYNENLFPVMIVVSAQVNNAVYMRYVGDQLLVLKGVKNSDPTIGTFAFCERILGYSLSGFFDRNAPRLRREIMRVVKRLLTPR